MDLLVRKLQNALKLGGFNIRRTFCLYIVEKFAENHKIDLADQTVFEETIKVLCATLENQCLAGRSIEKEHVERAVEVCLRSGYDQHETVCTVINAFEFPKLHYNNDRKLYQHDQKNPSKLLSEADVKPKLFLDRYAQVLQRTKRAVAASLLNDEAHQLTLQTVDYLLTLSKCTLERTVILGSILRVAENEFVLEDPTGVVKLDLTHTKYHPGFYGENMFVLVNGYYEDRLLHVSTMIMPTGEEYTISRQSFGNINYFGGHSDVPLKDSKRLQKHLLENPECMFVVLSDVWLDHPQVFTKLEKLFEQMELFQPPIAFIFMGNFQSRAGAKLDELKRHFRSLAELISKFHVLQTSCQFIFVPGIEDPATPHIVPRFELPSVVTADMTRLVPNSVFATNPCRIQYCNKEIVVFRADVVAKLLQSTLHKPARVDIPKYVTKTLIGQGHLCPLSLNALNVHWDFDYCMSLYPLPDAVILGDKSEGFTSHYKGCLVINPGQFCTADFDFKMYYPDREPHQAVEDCSIGTVE